VILTGLDTDGVGGSTDLPIPFLYAMVGASWALTISFAVLALAWREPKFDAEQQPPEERRRAPFGEPQIWTFLSTHTSTLAALKVSFVVAGHVLAVVAAHDRALIVLPRAHRLSGQLGMLLLMVTYTFSGLFLLFSV